MELTATSDPAAIPSHFPLVTRTLLELLCEGRLPHVERCVVEPEYGLFTRVLYRGGGVRIVKGSGSAGFNPDAAGALARDKGWTSHFLRTAGWSVPHGARFIVPALAAHLDARLSWRLDDGFAGHRTTDDVGAWVASNATYPVYAKPATGTQGEGVRRCPTEADLVAAVAELVAGGAAEVVVEEEAPWPDHRLVVHRGRLLLAYSREPLTVVGDGTTPVRALLAEALADRPGGPPMRFSPDDPRVLAHLAAAGLDHASVLAAGERVAVVEVSNLSAGGRVVDRTAVVADRWRDLAVEVTAAMGLDWCGVDLACPDLTDPDTPYAVLELNSSPGFAVLAASGPEGRATARGIYAVVFDDPPR